MCLSGIIFTHMESVHERKVFSRLIRPGEPISEDRDWLKFSPAERMDAVWYSQKCVSPGRTTPSVSPDFRDLLAKFNAHGVEYLVVGALA